MKNIFKIILIISLFLPLSYFASVEASVSMDTIKDATDQIKKVSMKNTAQGDLKETIQYTGKSILRQVKAIIGAVAIIFMVYLGITMVISMGSDEEKLSGAKRQLRYTLIALLFINIPGTLFTSFSRDDMSNVTIDTRITTSGWTDGSNDGSLLVNPYIFGYTVNDNIIGFLKIMIGAVAVFMIILAGVKILTARGREDQVSEAKNKIFYSIAGLIFVGVIETWKQIAFSGSIEDGKNLFDQIANLALYFAGPVGIFFLILAGYYYVTSAGDEEKTKKAKTIVINTVLATLILLAAYTFLLDLATL